MSQPAPRRGPGRPPKLAALRGPVPAMPIKAPLRTFAVQLRRRAEQQRQYARYLLADADMTDAQADAIDNIADAPAPTPPAEGYISAPEAAKRLRIDVKQLYRWIEQGGLPVLCDPLTGARHKPYRLRIVDVDAMAERTAR